MERRHKGIFPRCGGARCLGPTHAVWMSPLPHCPRERARVRAREQAERATVPNNYWSSTNAGNPNNAWNVNFNNGNSNNNNKTNNNYVRAVRGGW